MLPNLGGSFASRNRFRWSHLAALLQDRMDHRRLRCGLARIKSLVVGGNLAVDLLVLLVVIGFDHVADYRTGGFAAVPAALHDYGNNDFGSAVRRVAHEPGVILKFALFADAIA